MHHTKKRIIRTPLLNPKSFFSTFLNRAFKHFLLSYNQEQLILFIDASTKAKKKKEKKNKRRWLGPPPRPRPIDFLRLP
jgi:hypothetical protein